ncbi:hypothetical protein [Streptomyces sp. NPDC021020]|uniref:hypothetical protein n=1 Tax=Streptomyces sp. NPDC021020 TaxID=3365109 RepID=UPI0037A134DF
MTDARLDVLLSAAEPGDEQRIRERLGLPAREPESGAEPPGLWSAVRWVSSARVPAAVALWMLECDRPEINEIVFMGARVSPAVRRDIRLGLPFGDRTAGVLPVSRQVRTARVDFAEADADGAVAALRAVRSMKAGRTAAALVRREHWDTVDAEDRAHPLPGYARWALAIRIDCPEPLRERLGAGHPSFAYRMRQAGIIARPGGYVREWGPARDVLDVLAAGRWAFPARLREARAELRPLVGDRLGGNTEAWAVAAQLLPTFAGTVPELVVTAGAVA